MDMTAFVIANSPLNATCWTADYGYPLGTVAWSSIVESEAALAAAFAGLGSNDGRRRLDLRRGERWCCREAQPVLSEMSACAALQQHVCQPVGLGLAQRMWHLLHDASEPIGNGHQRVVDAAGDAALRQPHEHDTTVHGRVVQRSARKQSADAAYPDAGTLQVIDVHAVHLQSPTVRRHSGPRVELRGERHDARRAGQEMIDVLVAQLHGVQRAPSVRQRCQLTADGRNGHLAGVRLLIVVSRPGAMYQAKACRWPMRCDGGMRGERRHDAFIEPFTPFLK